jgi:hypothetical protein
MSLAIAHPLIQSAHRLPEAGSRLAVGLPRSIIRTSTRTVVSRVCSDQDVRLVDDADSGVMGDLRVLHDLLHGLITHTAEILVYLQQRDKVIADADAFLARDGYDPRTRLRGRCWRCR